MPIVVLVAILTASRNTLGHHLSSPRLVPFLFASMRPAATSAATCIPCFGKRPDPVARCCGGWRAEKVRKRPCLHAQCSRCGVSLSLPWSPSSMSLHHYNVPLITIKAHAQNSGVFLLCVYVDHEAFFLSLSQSKTARHPSRLVR